MGSHVSRRLFLGAAGASGLAASAAAQSPRRRVSANDRIRVGMIAVGSRGQELIEAMKQTGEAEIVSVCDAYSGRVERAIERTGGKARDAKNAEGILSDDSLDAIVISTPDHLHKDHVIAALEAGRDVYCEKPLTYTVDDGLAIIDAAKRSRRLLQVGSNGMSSVAQQKAKEIIQSGGIGRVTMITASYNRNSASGAWIYPIPPDANPETVDWKAFLGKSPAHEFDLPRFFRWRCYKDYSGGIATDLFVHLCTTIHHLMDAKMASEVVAFGDLYRWKESRDVPDTLNAILRYPEGFTVNLSSTFNNAFSQESAFQFLGTEGTLVLGSSGLKLVRETKVEDNGWIVRAWPRELERKYYSDARVKQSELPSTWDAGINSKEEVFRAVGPDSVVLHFENFFRSVRERKPTVQNELQGHRAASCAHMINRSAESGQVVKWDFSGETIVG